MPQVDGDIKLTATLTPGDIRKTAQQLKNEMKGIFDPKGSDQLSTRFKSVQSSIVKTIDKIDTLEKKLASLETAQIPTQEYAEIQKMIDDAEKGLQKLSNKMYDFKMEGGDTTSEAYHKMQAQADELNETIAYGKGELQDLVETGKAFTLGTDTEQYKQVATQLNEANNQLVVQKARLEDINSKEEEAVTRQIQKAHELGEKRKEAAEKAQRAEEEAIKKQEQSTETVEKATKAQDKHEKAVRRTGRAHKSASFSIDNFGKSIKKGLMTILKYGLGIRGLFSLFRKLRSAIKEGFENLQEFSSPLKESVEGMKASFTAVKNSIASAFLPLAERFIPIITSAADRLTELFNNLSRYMAILFNRPTYTKAVKVQSNYAKSLEKTADAAKEAAGSLASFDELTVIDTNNGAGSLADAADNADEIAKMFDVIEVATGQASLFDKFPGLTSFFEDLSEKFEKLKKLGGEFVEFFKQLNFDPLKKSISNLWNNTLSPLIDYIIDNAHRIYESVTKFLVEEGLPTAINIFSTALNTLASIAKPLIDSGFFEDLVDKISKINAIFEKFNNFVAKLDFSPLGEAISSLWNNALSPIIDRLIEIADWFREHVIQPITKFLTEKAIPAAIGAIEGALRAIWSILEPIISGLQTFWERNGSWIMQMIEDHTMTALGKIKEAFQAIGDAFRKNSDKIKGMFENIAIVVEKLSPFIKKISSIIGTHAWTTFVSSIRNILSSLKPILNLLSGIFEILGGIFSGNFKKVKAGLKDIGLSLWDTILFPIKLILRAIADIADALGNVFPGLKNVARSIRTLIGDTNDEEDAIKAAEEAANKALYGVRAGLDGVANTSEEVEMLMTEGVNNATLAWQREMGMILQTGVTTQEEAERMQSYLNWCKENGIDPLAEATYGVENALETIDPQYIRNVEQAVENAKRAMSTMDDEAKDTFLKTQAWADYCVKWGIDPITVAVFDVDTALKTIDAEPFETLEEASSYAQFVISQLDDEAKDSFTKTTQWINFCKTYGLDPLTGALLDTENEVVNLADRFSEVMQVIEENLSATRAKLIGANFGRALSDNIQSSVRAINIPATVQIQALNNQIKLDKKMENLLYLDTKNMFATGGYPTPGSLFWAGENGLPEMLGTVGGRTAVAGSVEITGIREEIVRQGAAEQRMLSQLISAVANKDLTLVANSKTGRWVNQSLKAYAGVMG